MHTELEVAKNPFVPIGMCSDVLHTMNLQYQIPGPLDNCLQQFLFESTVKIFVVSYGTSASTAVMSNITTSKSTKKFSQGWYSMLHQYVDVAMHLAYYHCIPF